MKTFKEYLDESTNKVSVGQEVEVHYKKMNGDSISRGKHKITRVTSSHFEIDREGDDGKPMKFKHNGYSKDYGKSYSGRVKGLSRTSGYYIKSLTDDTLVKESRAMKILQSKIKELETRKRFETGQVRIPTAKEREEQMKSAQRK